MSIAGNRFDSELMFQACALVLIMAADLGTISSLPVRSLAEMRSEMTGSTPKSGAPHSCRRLFTSAPSLRTMRVGQMVAGTRVDLALKMELASVLILAWWVISLSVLGLKL